MGLRGPAPTPTKILRLTGSKELWKRAGEPKPEEGRPKLPTFLESDEEKREWRRLCALLLPVGILTKLDGNSLGRYVRTLTATDIDVAFHLKKRFRLL